MGVETALIAGVAGSQLLGGTQANKEAKKQARIAEEQAQRSAELEADDVKRQLSRATTLFAKSGVSLEGSPLFVLQESAQAGVENVQDILSAGATQADSLRASGRQQLLGSIGSAVSTGAGAF
jgi:hypothetical protein